MAALVITPSSAYASVPPNDPVSEVEELAAEARGAYGEGRFDAAIGFYLRAYRLEPAAALLYNIAYVYDKKLSEPALAVAYYRRYVQAPDAEPDVVERAIQRIGELKKRPAVPLNPATSSQPTTPTFLVRPGQVRTGGQVVGGWVTFGVGVLGLAGAATMSVLASDTLDKLETETELQRAHSLRDTGKSRALAADVMWGAGGAAVVIGLVLVITADDDRQSASTPGTGLQLSGALVEGGGLVLIGGAL
jgi:tetratricopeptide (TPR) repeat protein